MTPSNHFYGNRAEEILGKPRFICMSHVIHLLLVLLPPLLLPSCSPFRLQTWILLTHHGVDKGHIHEQGE